MSKIEALRATNREYSDGFGPIADIVPEAYHAV